MTDIDALGADVRARYGTPHRFCRETGLTRSMVYGVLSGKYGGNVERQAARIAAALGRGGGRADALAARLLEVACGRCKVRGKKKGRRCKVCRELAREQAVMLLRQGEGYEQN